jgi:hypothetical protein
MAEIACHETVYTPDGNVGRVMMIIVESDGST